MPICIDLPSPGALCDPLCFRIEGWVFDEVTHKTVTSVELRLEGALVGRTELFFLREDVNAAFKLSPSIPTGFSLFGHAPTASFGREATLSLQARAGEAVVQTLASTVKFITADHRRNDFGILLEKEFIPVQRREQVYSSGPSQAVGSAEALLLIMRALGPPPVRILNVGCGLGWYGRKLLQAGYAWHGAEMKESDCASMAADGLPHSRVNGSELPFPDGAFDAAMAIEVLEHVDEPRRFLREIRRVAPKRLLISVPNAELLAYLRHHLAAPWHMLEGDHRNFFTRWSLESLLREVYPRAEVFQHVQHPLRTLEGTPLYYNLFAVASA